MLSDILELIASIFAVLLFLFTVASTFVGAII